MNEKRTAPAGSEDVLNAYFLFGGLGLTLTLVSAIMTLLRIDLFASLALNLGASVVAVVIVEFTWRHYGGDPIMKAVLSLRHSIRQLGELEAVGMTSIKYPRKELDVGRWARLLRTATSVDLMAFTLAAEVSKNREVTDAIRQAIESNLCHVRVLTYPIEDDPKHLLAQRIAEEEIFAKGAIDRFRGAVLRTWGEFNKMRTDFLKDPKRMGCIELRVTTDLRLYTNVIRIDEQMWISPYLASCTGGESPVFEVSGAGGELFKLYLKEFNHIWGFARVLEPEGSNGS